MTLFGEVISVVWGSEEVAEGVEKAAVAARKAS
jgi:hypothetical protein